MICSRHTHRLAFAVAALAVCGALADGETPIKALKLDGNANANGAWITNLNAIVMDATGSIELPGAGVTTTVTAAELQVDGDTLLDFANRELAHAGLLIQGMPATALTNGAAQGAIAYAWGDHQWQSVACAASTTVSLDRVAWYCTTTQSIDITIGSVQPGWRGVFVLGQSGDLTVRAPAGVQLLDSSDPTNIVTCASGASWDAIELIMVHTNLITATGGSGLWTTGVE